MENNNQGTNRFIYTYSAKEQAEIQRIREKYTSPTGGEDKMARLRRLDARVTGTAQAVALAFGVVGVLILGFGMSLCLTELGAIFGTHKVAALLVGSAVGVIGGVIAALAYPTYNATTKRLRARYGPEILRLTEELMR
ncbi:MAG: hypothetical protein IKC43_01390 [Clostridia bacterium]|nr:hypothetical protein [Clostridia bacterium]